MCICIRCPVCFHLRHTAVYQGYPLCPPTCCQKPLATHQRSSGAVSRNGHGVQFKDWKTLTVKEQLSADAFSDVNAGELIFENERTLIYIWLFEWLAVRHDIKSPPLPALCLYCVFLCTVVEGFLATMSEG